MPPMSRILEEKGRTEFPSRHGRGRILVVWRHAPLCTFQSKKRIFQVTAVHPSPAPRSPRGYAARDRDRDRSYDRDYRGSKSKLLSRLVAGEERDNSHVRSMLAVTTDRLESETRRADEAESRIVDTLHRLRQAREATLLAQADAARVREELRMYQLRLEEAQREILRAQDVVNQLERDKADAEAEAARARTVARKFREERLIEKAREEGRRLGFQEGLLRGKDMGYYEARRVVEREEPRRYARRPVFVQRPADEEEQDENEDNNENDNDSGSQPEEIVPIARSPEPPWRPSSRMIDDRAFQQQSPSRRSPPQRSPPQRSPPQRNPPQARMLSPNSMSVTNPHIEAPSPIHPRSQPPPATPDPIPIPGPSSNHTNGDAPFVPIAIHNHVPSPHHPPVDIPPDNWIPYMDKDNIIAMPPPHELSRSPSPNLPPPDAQTRSQPATYEQSVRARDYAYAHGAAPEPQPQRAGANVLFSPQSRTSTNISQYDLVSSRNDRSAGSSSRSAADALAGFRQMIGAASSKARSERSQTPGRQAREDKRRISSPRGPRPREDLPVQLPDRISSPNDRQRASGAGSPFERLFKKRFRSRTSGSSSAVPDIVVESPSNTSASHPSAAASVHEPHLLSPESAQQPLPTQEDTQTFADQSSLPPLPELDLATPGAAPLSDGQLPAGFVPFVAPTPMEKPGSPDQFDMDFTSISSKPQNSPRSGPTYAVAPIPPGVVYPDPPGRGATPRTAAGVPLPPSPPPSSSSSSRRRGGSIAGHLSPLSLHFFSPLRAPD